MIESFPTIAALVRHFEEVGRRHMRGLPITNPQLSVEAVGARQFNEHHICVLISPWFMNLVLLPGNDEWASLDQGHINDVNFPRETLQFTICHDDEIGTFLSAVMFRSVSDFPDQETARGVAVEILQQLFAKTSQEKNVFSRRALFTGSGTANA